MNQEKRKDRSGDVAVALLLGLMLLGMLLPCTGGELSKPHPGMWKWGGYWFYPDTFFAVVTIVPATTACTIYGIVRQSRLEAVGWGLFGLIVLFMLFG